VRNLTNLLILCFVALLSISAARASSTALVVENKSNTTVQVWLTIGGGLPKGCATSVSQITATDTHAPHHKIKFIPLTGNSSVGRVPLAAHHAYIIANSIGTCLNGNLTFNALTSCPCGFGTFSACPAGSAGNVSLPSILINGSNFFEFNFNNGDESMDVSCNNGCNAIIGYATRGLQNWNWPAGTHKNGIYSTRNGAVCLNISPPLDQNCNVPAVYPYGLTTCQGGTSLCTSEGLPGTICPTHNGICQLNRTSTNSGGTVFVTYFGGSQSPCAN
jgi:hypothetical protein